MRVACPVLDAGVDDVEFEKEDMLEDVRVCRGERDGGEHTVEVGRLGRGLLD